MMEMFFYYSITITRPVDFIIILTLMRIRDDNFLYLENVVRFIPYTWTLKSIVY